MDWVSTIKASLVGLMIGTGRSWIDDSDGDRFAALASQLIMVNRNSSYDINERGYIGSRSTTEYLSISLTVPKTFSSVLTGFCSVILGVACLIPILTLVR